MCLKLIKLMKLSITVQCCQGDITFRDIAAANRNVPVLLKQIVDSSGHSSSKRLRNAYVKPFGVLILS